MRPLKSIHTRLLAWTLITIASVCCSCNPLSGDYPEYSEYLPVADIIRVEVLDSESLCPGSIVLSTYGSLIIEIDRMGRISSVFDVAGPVNTWIPGDSADTGMGIVYGRPNVYADGCLVFDGTSVREQLDGFLHHEFILTQWGTYMFLVREANPSETHFDDILVEIDKNGNILYELSLNTGRCTKVV